MNPIQNVPAPLSIPIPSPAAPQANPAGPSFKDLLTQSIQQVNTMQHDADRAVEAIVSGEDVSAAEVLTAVQKADVAFRMMMQIRNKIVQAYQEVQNMRV
jgi:flagellar hook-basal body complex protein FliE